jgi:hypothetical protein
MASTAHHSSTLAPWLPGWLTHTAWGRCCPAGGTKERRALRGGSYVDSLEGTFNHAIRVSTRMENTADSGGANTGAGRLFSEAEPPPGPFSGSND